MMHDMLLHGGTDSGHSCKVHHFLLLAGVPHRCEGVGLGLPRSERPLAFRAASQFGGVPVLVDGGRAHCQSNAILMHLARRTGQMSGAASEQASVTGWLCWEANRVGFSAPNLARWLDRVRALPGWQHPDRALLDHSTTARAGTSLGSLARELP